MSGVWSLTPNLRLAYCVLVGKSQRLRPGQPIRMPLDDDGTFLLVDEEEDRVMPTRADLENAGRYNLHAAITFHGGYKKVRRLCLESGILPSATELLRPSAWV